MIRLLMLNFIVLNPSLGNVLTSPCPAIFQYGYDDENQPIGIIELTVPKTQVYSINVSAIFFLQSTSVNTGGLPSLSLSNEKEVIKTILTGQPIQLTLNYDRSQFRLYRIALNNAIVCEEKRVSPENKTFFRITYISTPPVEEISKYKDNFPIDYNAPDCGVPKTFVDEKKYLTLSHGGEKAEWADWPWIASIYISNEYVCTGNLISRSVVITAAHCFGNETVLHHRIKIGLFNNQNVSVWGYLHHSDHQEYKNDIALVYLSEDITDPNFVPVCISQRPQSSLNGAMISFGEDEFGQTGKIHFLTLKAVANSECRVSNVELQSLVQDSHICGGNLDGTGPCSGDSGSGFVFKENQKWLLRGLLSSSLKDGEGSCDRYNYAVFVDVLHYISWIPARLTRRKLNVGQNCGTSCSTI